MSKLTLTTVDDTGTVHTAEIELQESLAPLILHLMRSTSQSNRS